ncbi:tetratricopeptide repeat protein [Phormidesmis priestleyi ULC007]|uniref:Tetratricopeptide repeat protein n=1 Tax=Phormidesmis priestleyi ULC007 TaxID=1920490 RepID=A0A2T1D5X0_9CYAN|nr:tetratricopeptide repeat protein [Phormidesmis priestleyi]PSB15847.1 tetratricopeptide repeat protein [Phormidesmis priestleyi ULC007]PZO45583.1 MAG: tetratricopeptide repeat protein [Phormidesmis priestleyi]
MSDSEAKQLLQDGDKLYAQGDYYSAIDAYSRALETYQEIGDLNGEAETFSRIAKVYQSFSEWASYDAEKLHFCAPDDPGQQPTDPRQPKSPQPKSRKR